MPLLEPLRRGVRARMDARDDYPRRVLWATLIGMFGVSLFLRSTPRERAGS